jgi:predicted RNA methylase
VVYKNYLKASAGGADGGVIGFNGSVNSSITVAILRELDAANGTTFDFGAGDCKFLISAAAAGAKKAIGVEYAENIGHKLIFDAVVQRIESNHYLCLSVEWVGNNIEQV